MKSFEEFILQEAQTTAAFEMEKVIVAAAGGPEFTPRDRRISPDVGKKIIKDLKLSGKGAMPANTYDVTSDWASYFPGGKAPGSTKTPKTDFIIGNKRISLKTGKGAQLMSGGKSEATATFYAACRTGNIPIDGAIKTLEGYFKEMMATTVPKVKGNARELIKSKQSDIINSTNKVHQQFKGDLRDVFSKNPKFAYEFTYEAMTGTQKFGSRSVGTAQYFLVTSWDGSPAYIHDAFKDKGYVKKISKQVVPEARFKSGSQRLRDPRTGATKKTGFYSIYSAVGLGIKNMTEQLESLEGEILSEALFDKIRNIWNKFKNYMKRVWEQAKRWIGNNWQRLLQFLGLEPQVYFNNNPRW